MRHLKGPIPDVRNGIKSALPESVRDEMTTGLNDVYAIRRLTNGYLPPIEHLLPLQWRLKKPSAWRTNTLVGNARADKEEDEREVGYFALEDEGDSPGLNPNLGAAEKFVSWIVSADILSSIDAPDVRVIGRLPSRPPHRAYQRSGGITIDTLDDADVIVHEVGHYLEEQIASLWWAASSLRDFRDQVTRTGIVSRLTSRKAEAIPENEEPNELAQGRYAGAYLATGPYTSKVYETLGATEVVSMTIQQLCKVETAKNLIEKDPVLLMTVLAELRPQDEDLQEVCEKFAEYLHPRGDRSATPV